MKEAEMIMEKEREMEREEHERVELDRLQRWMQATITHPEGVARGVDSEEAHRGLDVGLEDVERIVTPSSTLTAAQRLAIYGRSYHARLLQCFRAIFPTLLETLGEELFDRFAIDYLNAHPPRGYTLDRLADDFPAHLAATRPDADAPIEERESWPDLIIELATLELAVGKVYDGPGLEGAARPDARDLDSLSDEQFSNLRPAPAPSLRLFTFHYPIHTYFRATRRGEKQELPGPLASHVAITRLNYRVTFHELTSQQYSFLAALDGECTVADALLRAGLDIDTSISSSILRAWVAGWMISSVVGGLQPASSVVNF